VGLPDTKTIPALPERGGWRAAAARLLDRLGRIWAELGRIWADLELGP
jgi:hypothetical protein